MVDHWRGSKFIMSIFLRFGSWQPWLGKLNNNKWKWSLTVKMYVIQKCFLNQQMNQRQCEIYIQLKLNAHYSRTRAFGLVVWFSLRVREVPSSILGMPRRVSLFWSVFVNLHKIRLLVFVIWLWECPSFW